MVFDNFFLMVLCAFSFFFYFLGGCWDVFKIKMMLKTEIIYLIILKFNYVIYFNALKTRTYRFNFESIKLNFSRHLK